MSTIAMPPPIDMGQRNMFTMYHLISEKKNWEEGDRPFVSADRYACGFPIPPFQRDLVWTPEQEERFMESVWLGLPIGTYCVHSADWEHNGEPKPMSGWLIDGQQRLTTIERYLDNEFAVFGSFHRDLSPYDRRRFGNIVFPMSQVKVFDEQKIKELYNLMAFGGTPHSEDDYVELAPSTAQPKIRG